MYFTYVVYNNTSFTKDQDFQFLAQQEGYTTIAWVGILSVLFVIWAVHIYKHSLAHPNLRADTCCDTREKLHKQPSAQKVILREGFAVVHGVLNISNNKTKDTY